MQETHRDRLRQEIEERRELIEQKLAGMDEGEERTALEGKLRDLEGLISGANWQTMPAHALDELRAWLDEWPGAAGEDRKGA